MRMWRDWPGFSDTPIEEEFYENAEAKNAAWPGYSARESLLAEFVDRFVNVIDGMNGDDDFWERMHDVFSDVEIGNIVTMAGVCFGTGHALTVFALDSVCQLRSDEQSSVAQYFMRIQNHALSWQ